MTDQAPLSAEEEAVAAATTIFKNLLRWDGLPQTKADRIASWLEDTATLDAARDGAGADRQARAEAGVSLYAEGYRAGRASAGAGLDVELLAEALDDKYVRGALDTRSKARLLAAEYARLAAAHQPEEPDQA